MRRYVAMAAMAGLLFLAAASFAWMRSGAPTPERSTAGVARASRFHPGLIDRGSAGENEEYREAAGANPRWPGAGRHEEWRGCRHTYQPALTAWIFAGGRSDPGAVASPAG
jgi:hypothetical protein